MTPLILIIDDSLTVRMDLVEAFAAAGFKTLACANAAQARTTVLETPVDLIILDLQLPDADGGELLQELRGMPHGQTVPVIMLSSRADVEDRVQGLRSGADEYVGKPYDIGYVIAKSRDLLRGRHPRPSGVITVLLIDDSPTFREALRAALEASGYAVLATLSGEEGLRMASEQRPDVVIVDGVLPGIDGATVIRHLRLDAALRRVPCLLLTGSGERNAEIKALDAGADAFAIKDESMAVILAKLSAILRRPMAVSESHQSSLFGAKRILAVDDSQTYLQELSDTLRGEGYDVVAAHSGDEALTLLAAQTTDCILLDLMMPGLSGEETCRRIKSAPGVRDIPLIMLTSRDDPEALIQGLSAGADDYISKVSEFEVLKARVRVQIRRKQFEDENRRIRDQLQQREVEALETRGAHELAQTRAVLVEELQRKNQELEAFSYSVSHDLRAPLRVIGGFSKILIADHAHEISPDARGLLSDIAANTSRMENLINDLLRLARVGLQPLTMQSIDVEALVRSIVDEQQLIDGGKIVLVRMQGVARCRGDEALLRQVFVNLISNARKFTRHAQEPTIEVSSRELAGRIEYSVHDNGVGFPAKQAHRLFGVFKRLHREEEFEGTGVGLSIVQRIIHRHGGSISAESEAGSGATFRFTLPRDEPAAS
jgi:two-component system NtrC family sensor kinase